MCKKAFARVSVQPEPGKRRYPVKRSLSLIIFYFTSFVWLPLSLLLLLVYGTEEPAPSTTIYAKPTQITQQQIRQAQQECSQRSIQA